jgi:hypothetical protein
MITKSFYSIYFYNNITQKQKPKKLKIHDQKNEKNKNKKLISALFADKI